MMECVRDDSLKVMYKQLRRLSDCACCSQFTLPIIMYL